MEPVPCRVFRGAEMTLKSYFLALKNYRNPLGHARDIDIVEQKQGEAAVVWFRRILSAPVDPCVAHSEPELTDSDIKRV